MNQVILFTPIGGTDPISLTNYHDGSMLHICRFYHPDRVILYMSKEMLAYQEQDDRYRYCLDRLFEMQGRTAEYEIIERPQLTNVHEFDYFYQDFREIISSIYKSMDATDTLLLNISSGTPAMKSGLAVLQTMGEFPAKLIQVETPTGKMNEHIHKGYDVQLLWEMNEDNSEDCRNRCREIQCPTLSKIKKEEIIKKHILAYDYPAALDVINTLPEADTADYRDLVYLASRRIMLDLSTVNKIAMKTGFSCLPVRSSSECKFFEYALNMDIRLRKEEYVDFIRSVTPIIVDMFEIVLEKQCGIVVKDYCYSKKLKGNKERREWDRNKLQGTSLLQCLQYKYQGRFQYGTISSDSLYTLIENCSDNRSLIQLCDSIHSVEPNIRNLAAHQVISVTADTIIKLTGFTGKQIMDMIKELFTYTGFSIKKEYWDSYDEMNTRILSKMSIE